MKKIYIIYDVKHKEYCAIWFDDFQKADTYAKAIKLEKYLIVTFAKETK